MKFLRHVGKHGDRKIALVFREVPGEEHMCLVTYTELLNRHIHDPLIQCIESDIGQNSENLADALNRSYTQDGRPILATLHKEGFLKKVQTEQVIMTPSPNTQIKLNELNKLLDEMNRGEEAVKRLAELDNSRGMQSPADVARRMRNNQQSAQSQTQQSSGQAYLPTDMSDPAIAWRMREQANKMAAEARGLIAESDRMLKEAAQLDGTPSAETKPATPAKRGRPPRQSKAEAEAQTMTAVLSDITPVAKTKRTRAAKV